MSPRWPGPALTLACAAMAAVAWWWAPVLVAGTPLDDLRLLIGFAAVLLCLRLGDIVAGRILRRLGHGH